MNYTAALMAFIDGLPNIYVLVTVATNLFFKLHIINCHNYDPPDPLATAVA